MVQDIISSSGACFMGVSGVGTSPIWKEAGTTENHWMDLHSGHCEYWLDFFSSDGYAASDGSS